MTPCNLLRIARAIWTDISTYRYRMRSALFSIPNHLVQLRITVVMTEIATAVNNRYPESWSR